MDLSTYHTFLKCYQELAYRVMDSANHDLLDDKQKKIMIAWVKKNSNRTDVRSNRKRSLISSKLLNDSQARIFISSEDYVFWRSILDLQKG